MTIRRSPSRNCQTADMSIADQFTQRSWVTTAITLTLALAAFAATLWYLRAGLPFALLNLAVAGLLLGGPLAAHWPITPRRAAVFALLWFAVGILFGYMFGAFVVYASLLLAIAVTTVVLAAIVRRVWLRRRSQDGRALYSR